MGLGADRVEFELLGMPFDGRGARADDALRVLRIALGATGPISYAGDHFGFADVVVDPSGARRPPVWVGGGTLRSLDRAIALADGWMPAFTLPPDRVARMLAAFDRPAGFTVVQPVFRRWIRSPIRRAPAPRSPPGPGRRRRRGGAARAPLARALSGAARRAASFVGWAS